MNIVVIGAGAVGGYFGGKLANIGYNVTFLVRPNRYHQLNEHGLKVNSIHGDFKIKPKLAKDVSEINKPDLAIVSLKNYHLNDAMVQISALVDRGAKILPLLNGIEHLDLLVSKFGVDNVIGGLCQIESTLNSEGEVVQTSEMQDVIFGSLTEEQPELLIRLRDMMDKAGLVVTLSDEIVADMWRKYIFIATLSGITSALRQPIGVALEDPITFPFLKGMIEEIFEIAKIKKVPLPDGTVDQVIGKLQSLAPTMTSSMHRDLEKGLPLELDSIHGTILNMAAEHELSTPNIKAIYTLLHPFKHGSV